LIWTDEDRIVNVVVDLDGNKGKSRFCKHVLLEHKAMLGKADGSVAILFVMICSDQVPC
jgi:hypothetical protein